MHVAVIVTTRNRRASLVRTLQPLAHLPEQPHVIVVDNGSHDGTPATVRSRFPAVELVTLDENLGAAARSVGAERAGMAYVAFSDDDSWWQPGAPARAVAILESHPRLAVVAARILVGPEEALDPTCETMASSPLQRRYSAGPAELGFLACGAVVRRDAYLEAGGSHRRIRFGDEERHLAIELARHGWQLLYAEDLVAHHRPRPPATRRAASGSVRNHSGRHGFAARSGSPSRRRRASCTTRPRWAPRSSACHGSSASGGRFGPTSKRSSD